MEIRELTALELGRLIRDRRISSPEAVRVYLDAAREDAGKAAGDEAKLNAYIELLEESALAEAEAVQKRLDAGEWLSPVAGVPVAVKDCICTKDGHTTAGSRMLEDFRAPYDSFVTGRLRDAGAVIMGKTNMDEFALGTSTETSYFGAVRNPWDRSRTAGGSSGGSAAAVAGGLAPCAIGTDAGGSLRQPCGFCNLTGVKPSPGTVSHFGLLTGASSLEQIGPMAKDARDCAAILSIISGADPRDGSMTIIDPLEFCDILHGFGEVTGGVSGSVPRRHTILHGSGGAADGTAGTAGAKPLQGRRIGLPANYLDSAGLEKDVKARLLEAAETLRLLGAEIVDIELPLLEYAMPAYLTIACAEVSSGLSRFDGIRYGYRSPNAETANDIYYKSRTEGFGDEVKRRILLGNLVLSKGYYDDYYKQAVRVRAMIKEAFERALGGLDLVLAPVCGTTAFPLGGRIEDPMAMYAGDTFTASANLAGLPAASAPCGFSESGLPVGMQLIGGKLGEEILLHTIARYQEATDFHKQSPPQSAARKGGR